MNKDDFINEIIKGFPESFKYSNIATERKKYEVAIENNLDYDKLYTLFLKNYKYKVAPAPAYFQDFFSLCRQPIKLFNMPSERRIALIKVAKWFNSPAWQLRHEFPPPEIYKLRKQYDLTEQELRIAMTSGEID